MLSYCLSPKLYGIGGLDVAVLRNHMVQSYGTQQSNLCDCGALGTFSAIAVPQDMAKNRNDSLIIRLGWRAPVHAVIH